MKIMKEYAEKKNIIDQMLNVRKRELRYKLIRDKETPTTLHSDGSSGAWAHRGACFYCANGEVRSDQFNDHICKACPAQVYECTINEDIPHYKKTLFTYSTKCLKCIQRKQEMGIVGIVRDIC